MADFVQALDPSKLVMAETALSFVLSPFTAPPYNLAIFLFGTYAQENTEGVQSLQTFTGLLGVSAIFDIVWMVRHDQNGFIRLLTILLLVLKVPTFFAFGLALRQRGSLGIRGNDLSGPTVWSMPGGFTSGGGGGLGGRDGYQTVDDERDVPTPPGPPKPSAPPAPATQPSGPGAYQSV